ncbi:uncharacterized protein FIESC28_01871 [Fusarium coffeatum]|uniref:Apple domain-containing protein n=1 Tax=Fusarium coffeatum TaxID=231269 RepID=A0A366S8E8_9HYPO|nr:uncharacterized protein FIESC28_01871 [Fusarium coffeatum]RBR25262.1 hypothetical protein FIESC28_01871 [Fusarium coffeatum]
MVALKSLLLLCTLGIQVGATDPTHVLCETKLGTASIASNRIPTATSTVVEKLTVVKKVIRKVNVVVVPRPKTSTVRSTSWITTTTLADPRKRTATSTFIGKNVPVSLLIVIYANIYFTLLDTITIHSTRTSTSVTSTDSFTVTTKYVDQTVPAPAGFTAILNDPLYEARRRMRALNNDQEVEDIPDIAAVMYPQRVDCTKKKPSTSTTTTTTIIQGPRTTVKAVTKTHFSTVVSITTSTEYPPDVETTVTVTTYPVTTVWGETTTVSTVTNTGKSLARLILVNHNNSFLLVTVESQIPMETVYLACKNDNILRTANNGGRVVAWTDVSAADNAPTDIGAGYTASECCAECQKRPFCRISLLDTADTKCYLYLTGTADRCSNGQQPSFGRYLTSNNSPAQPQWIYSNGPCGQLRNGGDRQSIQNT